MHPTAPGAGQGDDDWISVVARTDAEWRALCHLVPGLSGLAALDLGQRMDAQRVIDAALTAWAGSRRLLLQAESLLNAGIPAAALARIGDLVKSPHLATATSGQARCRCVAGIALRAVSAARQAPRRNWAPIPIMCSPTSLGYRRNVLSNCGRAARWLAESAALTRRHCFLPNASRWGVSAQRTEGS